MDGNSSSMEEKSSKNLNKTETIELLEIVNYQTTGKILFEFKDILNEFIFMMLFNF